MHDGVDARWLDTSGMRLTFGGAAGPERCPSALMVIRLIQLRARAVFPRPSFLVRDWFMALHGGSECIGSASQAFGHCCVTSYSVPMVGA